MAISLKENISIGLSDFWSRKVRGFVTVLGIVLGTMSVIVVLSLMNGINQQTIKWMMERGGLSKITVRRDWSFDNPNNEPRYFTWKEINLIRSLVPEAEYFNPQLREWVRYSYQDKDYLSSIYGVVPDFTQIEEWDVEEGRFISAFDIEQANDVVVIGTEIKKELLGNKDAIGELITVHNRRLRIIGIMKHRFMKSNDAFRGENALSYLNRRAFIPLSTMIKKGTGEDEITSFTVKAKDADSAPALGNKLEDIILNLRHGEPVFSVETAKENAEQIAKNQKNFQVIFFVVSIISLLVGGIVIANIMLASIQERTREIGIRIAVGARRRDIFFQFLAQTIIITAIGGIFGILTGLSILKFISNYIGIELIASISVIMIALAVSVGVGFVAGIIPAVTASKLNPVEALRYE